MGTVMRGLAVLVLAVMLKPAAGAAIAAETRYAVPLGDSPSIGAPGAPVVIVEFVDYQ